jgi:hypothetical protein
MKTAKPIGQLAYDAYCESTGGKSLVSGEPLPPWNSLNGKIKKAWDAAAWAVARQCLGDPPIGPPRRAKA